MAIKAGDRMPAGKLKTMTKDGPKDVTTDELFKGKKVVLFSVPGAFTPTCDAKHLPGFVQLADQIHAAFAGFVRDQDPGWPPYRQSKSIMVFDSDSATVNGGYESARALRS